MIEVWRKGSCRRTTVIEACISILDEEVGQLKRRATHRSPQRNRPLHLLDLLHLERQHKLTSPPFQSHHYLLLLALSLPFFHQHLPSHLPLTDSLPIPPRR